MSDLKQIHFGTKEKHKKMQEEAFLQLTPYERFIAFIRLCEASSHLFPIDEKERNQNNFILERKHKTSIQN